MIGAIKLNGTWGLTYAEGLPLNNPAHYTAPGLRGRRLMPARVPAPIHQVLMEAGQLDDPNLGMNSLKARWVEEQFWIYRHTFTAPAEACTGAAWLVFDRLEFEAEVWLNGEPVGTHANAHRLARFNVTGKLREGDNQIVVQLSTGMHSAADKPGKDYWSHAMEMLTKRVWQRKAAYQCGWDWNCRMMNVGILGDVRLEWAEAVRLDDLSVFAVVEPDLSAAKPRLWWPVGQGEPFRYTVEVAAGRRGARRRACTRRTGGSPRGDGPVAAPGGRALLHPEDQQPAHLLQGRQLGARRTCCTARWTPQRYRELVELAVEANFNMLRIWGGAHLRR
jgi:beta-mannosidase